MEPVKVIEFGQAKQSVRDLVRINGITKSQAPAFVTDFVRKFKYQGFYNELLQIAFKEIERLEDEKL
jgi:hypothetical protein